ncbi:putative coiled-coil domain-containing protein [Apostichopus japonicus]|uniref:Putative coiled-coil domain-containing protein n=1 Tax=Stichopus japonicus TaxID=307972 RepID=A0A2G8KRE3_STIJA|nr:putative coiled-coil domain-containing protein [Apostichopus japonicus]
MGKKKSKKSDKKADQGADGSSKKEPQMTIREAILAYQISIKENQLGELMFEKNGLEEKNQRNKERRDRLKEEQLHHIKTLLKQAKERDKELEEISVVNKEQVEVSLKDKWKCSKEQDQELEDLKREIENKLQEYEETQAKVDKWIAYRDSGRQEHSIQIKLLTEELVDCQQNFEEMKSHLEKTLSLAKEEIKRSTEDRLSDQKYVASEKAMTTLDKWTSKEVKDNDWLRREASFCLCFCLVSHFLTFCVM